MRNLPSVPLAQPALIYTPSFSGSIECGADRARVRHLDRVRGAGGYVDENEGEHDSKGEHTRGSLAGVFAFDGNSELAALCPCVFASRQCSI